ncbi:MAG: helix-turn-helix transcriptional regulator [Ruminococcaceae bacterium]|nr:helix-turn-helix transcriptional regulator [Oscillospiraceae bacterium]
MNQIKVGIFLKELRKEKGLTQQQLAEKLNVSDGTVSRWETGSNMPDIGMLVYIADFYDVSIPEIIYGERKSENMNMETRNTAVAMAEYSHNEKKNGKAKIAAALLSLFGIFIIISALSIFPSESSWGSVYSVLGSLILIVGIYVFLRQQLVKRGMCILVIGGCIAMLFAAFSLTDYIAAKHFDQVPRFRYQTCYDSRIPDQVVHKTIFFTAVQKNPGTGEEQVYILKR